MSDETYRFCKIFLRAESRAAMDLLAVLLETPFQRRTLTLPDGVVDVMRNPDMGAVDDFIGWPTVVEIDAEEHADRASVIVITSRIVTAMWDAGIPAVAACDYEDDLPWSGGIKRLRGLGQEC
ncbi:hypothetical protein [Labedaea rhizosphaerae]|uniref:hypothetical protein n=1 Tax=Labedaea rhizosphaerae TaxID=598644 RepID=UPI001061886A|nr:hypothetical protein [Labedaea rhizosphaerae]